MSSSRMFARFMSGRFSSSSKILSEEKKAAENIYKKKIEGENLEKLTRNKGPNPEEKPPTDPEDSWGALKFTVTVQYILLCEFIVKKYELKEVQE